MATIETIAREFNAQPYEIAAFFALGTDYSDHAELDAETEAWMREALTWRAELDAE